MQGRSTPLAMLTLVALLAPAIVRADNWLRPSEVVPHARSRTRGATYYQQDREETADANGNGAGESGSEGELIAPAEEVLPLDEMPPLGPDPLNFNPGQSAFPYDVDYWFELNAADQGVGYEGSFFSVGGLFPYAHDDLGGMWFVEARAHVSEHGNFFSNVGWGRRQYINPLSSMALSVWYDFDDDAPREFGHSFHQVGLSGDVQSDWWRARINGYIPVDRRDFVQRGFTGNSILLRDGIDSALDGIDGEFGFRFPTLAGRVGWLHFGGYAFQSDSVDSFSGFMTRLDLPSVTESAMLQVQVNHDDRFDTTAFVNFIFRFGTARGPSLEPVPTPGPRLRRTQRNAHIARVHQAPIVATNPLNGGDPWRIFHADSTADDGGDGSFAAPFNTLAAAEAAADRPFDIVLVRNAPVADLDANGLNQAYNTQFDLLPFQRLLGDGVAHSIPTQGGMLRLANDVDGMLPVLTNSAGPAVVLEDGSLVSGFNIAQAQTAILGDEKVSDSPATVDRVSVFGGNVGVDIADSSGSFAFTETNLNNTFDSAFRISGGAPDVDYEGNINNGSNASIEISATTGGAVTFRGGIINDNGGTGLEIDNAAGTVDIQSDLNVFNSPATGISITNSSGTFLFSDAFVFDPAGIGVELMDNNQSTTRFDRLRVVNNNSNTPAGLSIVNNSAEPGRSNDITISDGFIALSGGQAVEVRGTNVNQPNLDIQFESITSLNSSADGVRLVQAAGSFDVVGGTIVRDAAGDGIAVRDSAVDVNLNTVTVTQSGAAGTTAGVRLEDNTGNTTIKGGGSSVITGTNDGIVIQNSTAAVSNISNINVAQDAVSASNTTNNATTILLDRIFVSGTGRDGVRLRESSTSGSLNATITNSSLAATSDGVGAETAGFGGVLRLNLGFPPPDDNQGNDTTVDYVLTSAAGSTFELGGALGQGMTFTNTDNGNIANNGNTTNGGPPTVTVTGDVTIVDPDAIAQPPE